MPVSALTPRINRHVTGPGRGSNARRPNELGPHEGSNSGPALTVTVAIPLAGEALLPQAHKLIEAVRELVELSQGTVTVEPAAPVLPEPPAGPEVRIMTGSRQVMFDGELLPLTRLEFDLLLFLAEHPRRVFTRAQLLEGVWGYEHTGERTVDVHVRRLRLKLGAAIPMITTVYGVGYRLSDDAHIAIQLHD